jgi:signal transduction histidine kinase
VTIEVADSGIGIPSDELRLVTRKFFRGRRSNPGGSGLGLAIADRIVAEHGGSLSIESTVDAGTTVLVTLPVMERDGEAAHPHR